MTKREYHAVHEISYTGTKSKFRASIDGVEYKLGSGLDLILDEFQIKDIEENHKLAKTHLHTRGREDTLVIKVDTVIEAKE